MTLLKLDAEELELIEAYEAADIQSDLTEARSAELAHLARSSLARDQKLSIKISSRDLELLQRRALKEGLSYQALISSILHKYVSGSLADIGEKSL